MRSSKKSGGIPQWIYWVLALIIVICSAFLGSGADKPFGGAMQTSAPSARPSPLPDDGLYLHFIDVGQGDSALIVCDGEAMLVDAGEPEKGALVAQYLRSHGVKKLEYVVCTHAHSDHCGGLDDVADAFPLGTVFAPYTEFASSGAFTYFEDALALRGYSITVPALGSVYTLGGAQITFIGPVGDGDGVNSTSLIFRLDYGDASALFTGDTTAQCLSDCLAAGYDLDCDVLKLPHHGSSDGLDERLLNAMSPDFASASCAKNNEYGHPHDEIVSLLDSAGVTLCRTDTNGSIVLFSSGGKFENIS